MQKLSDVGIIMPTMGDRPELLLQCLRSIRAAGNPFVLLVSPKNAELQKTKVAEFVDAWAEDPRTGLVGAINAGFDALPESIAFCNWIGDDDLLAIDSLVITRDALLAKPKAAFAYGACSYIDLQNKELWVNKSGSWASKILRFGPDLIPQPGALIRKSALDQMGPLDPQYKFAFDFDMFLRLTKIGRAVFLPIVLASFRWHADSLTVSQRKSSAAEASMVRKAHLPAFLRGVSELWEAPLRYITNKGGAKLLEQNQAKS